MEAVNVHWKSMELFTRNAVKDCVDGFANFQIRLTMNDLRLLKLAKARLS